MEQTIKANSVERSSEVGDIDREWRAYNDASTWLAETLNGRMLTRFEYNFDGGELYASDGGALGPIFEKSIDDAYELANQNPELAFEVRRRQIELDEYYDMFDMAEGNLPNTMVVISDFPPELMDSEASIGGYNAERKQTMLRVISRRSDGRLVMQSQSLDDSNRQALEAIYASFAQKPEPGELLSQRIYIEQDEAEQEFLADKLTGVYDRSLETQNPGYRYMAGRLLPELPGFETYQFTCEQSDIVDYLAGEMLAGRADEGVFYAAAATMAKRYENYDGELGFVKSDHLNLNLAQEMLVAASEARAENRGFSGCGGTVSGGDSAESELSTSGYGNKTKDCEFTSKKCPKCGKKNVKTVAKNGKYYGACGCKS